MSKLNPNTVFDNKEEWSISRLNEIEKKVKEKNKDFVYDKVLTNSASRGVVLQSDYFKKSIANTNNINGYYVVRKNDFVYNPRISTDAPVGPISRNTLTDGIMSPLYTVFRIENMDLDFLDQYFKSTHWHKYMKSVANYGARHDRMAISSNDFINLPIRHPSHPEQQKIADFLTSVDKRIELLEKKKTLLETYKKGVMKKIFNQEIRFKDDSGRDFPEWKKKKLVEFKELIHGDGDWILSKDITIDEKYKIIQLGSVGFGKLIQKDLKTVSQSSFEDIKGTLIEGGDLLINRMVDQKLYACIFNESINHITSVDVCWIRENDYFDNYFLLQQILTDNYQRKLLNLSSGSGRVRISKKNLFEKVKFQFPCKIEQKKISNFLSKIDF